MHSGDTFLQLQNFKQFTSAVLQRQVDFEQFLQEQVVHQPLLSIFNAFLGMRLGFDRSQNQNLEDQVAHVSSDLNVPPEHALSCMH